MRGREVIYLISVTITEDEIGNQIETETERMVFADELAVFDSTFYNAALSGLRPSKMFEIYRLEYDGETKLKYENIVYRIIKTALGKKSDKLVLDRKSVV